MNRVCTAAFLVSVAFCVYTLVGYPLLLGVLARLRTKPVRKAHERKSVSVLLPVFNGAAWIGAKLETLLALDYPPELMEVLVVSDGSTDATDSIVGGYAGRGGIRLLRAPHRGKAAALNLALDHARGEILFFTDVRQQLHPESLANLVSCFADPAVGVASGELVILKGTRREEGSVGLYWRYEKWIRKRLSRVDSVLGATGCIYAMRRELAVPLPESLLVDDMYLPLAAFFRGRRVILDDSALAYDHPTQLSGEFRRKVRTLAGVFQIIHEYPALLSPANRMWIHFTSHKLARLFLPYALIAVAVSSIGLPAPWAGPACAAQALFYGLALADRWIPERSPLKRISSPCCAFVVLVAAALCASLILFVPGEVLWKETKVSPLESAHSPKSGD
jgi:poly-beta-1,6-N-acetyl-D-glucosamine synthase